MNPVRLSTSPHWNREHLRTAPPEEWQAVVDNLVGTLTEFFGADVECQPVRDIHDGEYVSVGFVVRPLSWAGLELTVSGILTISTWPSKSSPTTSVSMTSFLFSGQRRLVQTENNGDFLYAEFLHDGSGAAEWSPLRWLSDCYGEWEACVAPNSVLGD